MAEEVTLATPEVRPEIRTTAYRVRALFLDWEGSRIVVHLRGTNGELREVAYTAETAATLMRALNRADLSTASLQRRILSRLVADGFLAGAVSGTPE